MTTSASPAPTGLRLPPAPARQPRDGGAALLALPALGGLGSVALVASSGLAGSGAMRTRSLLAAGLFLLVTVAFVVLQVERQRRQRRDHDGTSREDHLHHLAQIRTTVREAAVDQRLRARRSWPEPAALLSASPSRASGLAVRIGTGTGPLSLGLDVPEATPGQPADLVTQRALDRFVATHGTVRGLPVTLDLGATPELAVVGGDGTPFLRALVVNAVAHRPPEELRVAVLHDHDAPDTWEWLKWLPHHASPDTTDATGPARLTMSDPASLQQLVRPGRHLLVIDERCVPAADLPTDGATVLRAGPPVSPLATALALTGTTARLLQRGVGVGPGDLVVDTCATVVAGAVARQLAARADPAESGDDLMELLHSGPRVPLRIPIGRGPSGAAVHLDLREPARGGHGPHGLVIGATGSGKSELLRTLVTGLALTHRPEELHLLLIDFKGGATFAGMSALPHSAGLVTNLADDLGSVDRLAEALLGELERRQRVLRDAGDVTSTHDLEGLPSALPTLLVVVDEFTELLNARPGFAEVFATVGRLGRSLGVHLLLASQRLDEGRLRGLESHLGFRVALRTFSATDSRAVIGTPEAHELPSAPGHGYLRVGPDELVRFRATLVTQPTRRIVSERILPFTAAPVTDSSAREEVEPPLLQRAVAAARAQAGPGRRARPIWSPPLSTSPLLRDLLAQVTAPGLRRLPVGIADLPREQRHMPVLLDLGGTKGHVAVVGAPRSGRSTALATVAAALAATTEATLTILDLDGRLAHLRDASGVTAYADRTDPARVRAVAGAVTATASARRASPTDEPPHVVLVDGWAALRERFPDVEAELVALAQESLAVGVHLVLTATRWGDVRSTLRDVVGTRLELRLGDALDSEHGRERARAVPHQPGHGLSPDGHHFLVAVTEPEVSADGRRPT